MFLHSLDFEPLMLSKHFEESIPEVALMFGNSLKEQGHCPYQEEKLQYLMEVEVEVPSFLAQYLLNLLLAFEVREVSRQQVQVD